MAHSLYRKAVAYETAKPNKLILHMWRYPRLRNFCRRLLLLEGPPMISVTKRAILSDFFDVHVGKFSYGDVLNLGNLPRGTTVGAWCSVGKQLIVRRRDHPISRLTQHPFFYNHKLGLVEEDTIADDAANPLEIGNDVWIGDRVTILSGCKHVGNGAVLAAGAVVTKDVPPYSIFGGTPAKLIRKRFSNDVIEHLEASQWWQLPLEKLLEKKGELARDIDVSTAERFAAWAEKAKHETTD